MKENQDLLMEEEEDLANDQFEFEEKLSAAIS